MQDGFSKPEISAPGRHMVGAVPTGANLMTQFPGRIVAPNCMWMSGTSFAAPVVNGHAALNAPGRANPNLGLNQFRCFAGE